MQARGYQNLILRTHAELDLEKPEGVGAFFEREKPEYVFLAAALVGGIMANFTYPVDFLLRNLKIQNNIIEASWREGVKGLLFLGSSCIYPKLASPPLKEEYILTGRLEPTNQPYAIGKIAGIELCEAFNRQYGTRFLSVMPTNLFGSNDNYDLETSHSLPAFIRKFHLAGLAARNDWEAVERDQARYGRIPEDIMAGLKRPEGPAVRLWGTGSPRREWLYVDDMAEACVFIMERLEEFFSNPAIFGGGPHLINIGAGRDITFKDLAGLVADIIGFDGPVEWDPAKPDGTPQKLLDVSRLKEVGWQAKITLEEGIRLAYRDYVK